MASKRSNAAKIADSEARKAEAEAKAAAARATAEAEKTKATAAAEASKVEAARIQAQAESDKRRDEAAAAREAKGKNPLERAYQLSINLAAPIAGIYAGHKLASKLEARHIAHLTAVKAQIKTLATEGRRALNAGARAKLPGIVKAADALKFAKLAGPLGLPTAALLLAEGAFARFVLAPSVENETAKEALRAAGTGFTFAATALVGTRMIQNKTTKVVPSAKDIATIENARAVAKRSGRIIDAEPVAAKSGAKVAAAAASAAKGTSLAARSLKVAGKVVGKVAIPITVGVAAYEGIAGYKEDGTRGAFRGVLDALDPTGIVMDKGIAQRAFDHFFGAKGAGPQASAASVSAARLIAGQQAAGRAAIEQRTPAAAPAKQLALPAPGKTTPDGRHHGWTDAARAASAKARGVAAPGTARK